MKKAISGRGHLHIHRSVIGRAASLPTYYFFRFLAIYTRSEHRHKWPDAKEDANEHASGFSSRQSRYSSTPKSFALQRFSSPLSAHLKFSGHCIDPAISAILFLSSSFMASSKDADRDSPYQPVVSRPSSLFGPDTIEAILP